MRLHAVWSSLSLFACADAPNTDTTTSTVVIDNRLSANRLSANRLSANRLSANRLSANRLSANQLELTLIDHNDLVCSLEGQEVLTFIISCAIDADETIIATNLQDFCGTTTVPDTFEAFGELGLANDWIRHPITDKGKGWVSACLFARVNASGVTIPISLRGNHHELTTSDDEKAGWSLQEGAFYGDYFDDTLEGHPNLPDWHACRGVDQRAGETFGLVERDCAEPDPGNPGFTLCGFAYAGECGFADDFACAQYSETGTYYKKCSAEDGFETPKPHGKPYKPKKTYKEVITTYVLGS